MKALLGTLRRLFLAIAVVMLIPWLATFAAALLSTTDMARNEVGARLDIIGKGIVREVETYLGTGVPIAETVGLREYFSEELEADEDVLVALVATSEGRTVAQYVRNDRVDLLGREYGQSTVWSDLGLTATSFVVSSKGQAVGTLLLAHEVVPAVTEARRVTIDFVVVLVCLLAIAVDVVGAHFRSTVEVPLRTLGVLEQRMGARKFDRVAPVPRGEALEPLIEAVNRLVVGMNDRYARLSALFHEIRDLSFNPGAPAAIDRFEARMGAMASFAPDGLRELPPASEGVLAGPAAFRAAVVVSVAGGMAAGSLDSLPVQVALATGALACCAGLLLSRVLSWLGFRAVLLGGALAALGLVALSLSLSVDGLGGAGAVPIAALVAAGVGAVAARVPPDGARRSVARLAHAAAGCAVGGGIVAIDATHNGQLACYVAAAIALGGLVLLALRYGVSGPIARPVPRLSLRLRWPQGDAVRAVAAGLAWVTVGLWIGGVDPGTPGPTDHLARLLGLSVWAAGLAFAGGALATRLAFLRWGRAVQAGAAQACAAVLLALVVGLGTLSPFAGAGVVAAAFILGVLCAGATSNDTGHAALGLVAGLVLSGLSVDPVLGGATDFLLLGGAAGALALAGRWFEARFRRAGNEA
jgi:hypothetical protein